MKMRLTPAIPPIINGVPTPELGSVWFLAIVVLVGLAVATAFVVGLAVPVGEALLPLALGLAVADPVGEAVELAGGLADPVGKGLAVGLAEAVGLADPPTPKMV